ncbi:MAG: hypothetical protein JWM77_1782, partial [Rhodospirillales bacterium]|nr:hypothetical protein [Rhodospirillales bacterium]
MALHSAQPRACFICGSATGTALQQHLLSVLGLGDVDYAVRCCSGCGLVLQDPVVAPAAVARQYVLFSNYLEQGTGAPVGEDGPVLNQAALRLVGQMERLG